MREDDHFGERLSLGFRMMAEDYGTDDEDDIPPCFDEDWGDDED